MKQILKKINRLLVQFKKFAATCSKCGDYNEYVEEDPNFVCYKCRTEKARMFGGEEKKKSEPQIKTQPGHHQKNKWLSASSNEIVRYLADQLIFHGFYNIADRHISLTHSDFKVLNLFDDHERDLFAQKIEMIVESMGFMADEEHDEISYINKDPKTLKTPKDWDDVMQIIIRPMTKMNGVAMVIVKKV